MNLFIGGGRGEFVDFLLLSSSLKCLVNLSKLFKNNLERPSPHRSRKQSDEQFFGTCVLWSLTWTLWETGPCGNGSKERPRRYKLRETSQNPSYFLIINAKIKPKSWFRNWLVGNNLHLFFECIYINKRLSIHF